MTSERVMDNCLLLFCFNRNGDDLLNMATTKEYKNFILEQLDTLGDITYRNMMGEYLLYHNGVLIGGIYDNRLLLKIVSTNKKYRLKESIPYRGAKKMYLVHDVDNKEKLRSIVLDTYMGLIN